MDGEQQSGIRSKERTIVSLEQIPTIQEQTSIVFKAMEHGLDTVFYASDPNNPQEGVFVTLPDMLQATYTCKECSTVVVRRLLKPDLVDGNIATSLKCTGCRGISRVSNVGPEKDVPVVYSERPKEGLEEYF